MPHAAARMATRDEGAGFYQRPSRADTSLSDRRRVLPGVHRPFGRAVQVTAGRCATRIRRIPEVRLSRTRLFTGVLRIVPRRAFGRVQL